MDLLPLVLTIAGLSLFEIITSIDNAIINAEVLSTMGARMRKIFLTWGLLIAVFAIRGALPWMIVWATIPSLGPIGSFTAALSSDPKVKLAVEEASSILLIAGGVFLIFLFFHWLFLEDKNFGLRGERFFQKMGVWYFAFASVFLTIIVWLALKQEPLMAFGAVVGSTAFFIIHGFKQNAASMEKKLLTSPKSDFSKLLYLEVIDATFSIDGVLGAFAFTFSVPLILLGNGIGAVVLRQLTVSNIDRIKKYIYLKNGAMYSILCLGVIMTLESFHFNVPHWLSPVATLSCVSYFFLKSKKALG